MTANLRDSLPDALREVRIRPFFVMRLDVHPLQIIGAAPGERPSIPSTTTSASHPLFETAAPGYAWLNNVIAIGIGHRRADGPNYSIFEVL